MVLEDFFEVVQLSRGTRHGEFIAPRAAYGDSGRVIATVFEASQPLDNDGNDLLGADIANDSAHIEILRYLASASL
jgi:hypothetical protein